MESETGACTCPFGPIDRVTSDPDGYCRCAEERTLGMDNAATQPASARRREAYAVRSTEQTLISYCAHLSYLPSLRRSFLPEQLEEIEAFFTEFGFVVVRSAVPGEAGSV